MYLEARKRQEALDRQRRAEEEHLRQQQLLEARRKEQLARELAAERERNRNSFFGVPRGRVSEPSAQDVDSEIDDSAQSQSRPHSEVPATPQSRQQSNAPSSQPQSFSHPNHHPSSSPRKASASSSKPTPPPTPKPVYTEAHEEAATKIQTRYRAYRSINTIRRLEAEFDTLKNAFTLPTKIDFQGPNGVVSVQVANPLPPLIDLPADSQAKLAYTQTNYALHAYGEALSRLLIKLDGVQSWGEKHVRERRKGVARRIEAEAGEVEDYWKRVWAAYAGRPKDLVLHGAPTEVPESDAPMDTDTEETSNASELPAAVATDATIDQDVVSPSVADTLAGNTSGIVESSSLPAPL